MSSIAVSFQELFYGAGMWLGILILLGLVFTLAMKNKYCAVIAIPITSFLGMDYIANATTQSHYWGAIIMFFATAILFVMMARKGK